MDVNLADLAGRAMGGAGVGGSGGGGAGGAGGRGAGGGVAVFDSGLGSLSVIRRIRRAVPAAPVVYLADTANYPYGTRSPAGLRRIVEGRARLLRDRFRPDVVVVGSITPTLLLPDLFAGGMVVGVAPPLRRAAQATRTGHVGVLATRSVVGRCSIGELAAGQDVPAGVRLHPIDASPLVDLVESGAFLDDGEECAKRLARLGPVLAGNRIDSIALSSTHLPFLAERLAAAFPDVRLADPGEDAAEAVRGRIGAGAGGAGQEAAPMRIFTSGDPAPLEGRLRRLGVSEAVRRLDG